MRINGDKVCVIVSNTIDGTKEVEFEIEDFEKANEFLENIGFKSRSY